MLKQDPNIRRLRWFGIIEIVFGVIETVTSVLVKVASHDNSLGWWTVLMGPYLLVFGVLLLTLGPRAMKRLDKQRHAAAFGAVGDIALAAQQPEWHADALPLPLTIKVKPNWRFVVVLLAACCILAVGMAFGFFGLIQAVPQSRRHRSGLVLVLAIAIMLFVVFAAMIVALYVRWQQRISVTEDGLTTRTQGHTETIRWDEARLFAVVGVGPAPRTLPPRMYELSGERAVVRWYHVRQEQKPHVMQPDLPWPEYERQMEALLSVIAGRTHLPLYDLREPPRRLARPA